MPWSPIAKDRPPWMRVRLPSARSRFGELDEIVRGGGLHTVCEEARCPNIGECWGRGTATFQIMGDTCTRACRYCAVNSRKHGEPLDPLEPGKLAAAAQRMGLRHVVVTSVDRDDLADRGAGHWAQTIRALKRRCPDATSRCWCPTSSASRRRRWRRCSRPAPTSSTTTSRPAAGSSRSSASRATTTARSWLLRRAKQVWAERWPERGPLMTKSGIVAGMGETDEEILETMRDLRAHDVDVVTIGQYLQPTARHLPLDRWVPLTSFRRFREEGEAMGFGCVFAGPLVRSSYRAEEQRLAAAGASRVVTL